MTEDFDRPPSKITHRTRVALPLAAVATVVGSVVYGSWQLSKYAASQENSTRQTQEQLQRLDRKNERMEETLNDVSKRLVRVEFKVDGADPPRRRRP